MTADRPRPVRPAPVEALAWIDLAARYGWGKERPILPPLLRGGAHADGCGCVDCEGRLGGAR